MHFLLVQANPYKLIRVCVLSRNTERKTERKHRTRHRTQYRGFKLLSPYGLDIIESCLVCKMRVNQIFCDLPESALQSFEQIKYATAYPKGAILFVEGQAPRGIFVLCKGRVKLSICSTDGKTLILKIAEAGEVLGLSASVSGKPYELTAETIDPCQVNFVKREDFLRFLKEHAEACLRVAEQLSEKYNTACREIRSLGLSHSAAEKLANPMCRRYRSSSTCSASAPPTCFSSAHKSIGGNLARVPLSSGMLTGKLTRESQFADRRASNRLRANVPIC